MTRQQSGAAQLMFIRPIRFGAGALVSLLAIYFGVVSLISGMNFAFKQFAKFWHFIVPLALGGHHRKGLLHFKGIAPQSATVGLQIRLAGDSSPGSLK